ncbi:MAG: hypothetical protein ABIB04_05195 [Patescibacteria group bacterium]
MIESDRLPASSSDGAGFFINLTRFILYDSLIIDPFNKEVRMSHRSIRTFFKIPAYAALTAVSPAVAIIGLPVTLPLFCIGVVNCKRMVDYYDQDQASEEEEESGLSYIFAASAICACILAPFMPIISSHQLLTEAVNDFRAPRKPARITLPVSP